MMTFFKIKKNLSEHGKKKDFLDEIFSVMERNLIFISVIIQDSVETVPEETLK